VSRRRFEVTITMGVPDSSVGIVTRYGLDVAGIESRWGARFSAPIQTVFEAHPAFCNMITRSLLRIKQRGVALTAYLYLTPGLRKE